MTIFFFFGSRKVIGNFIMLVIRVKQIYQLEASNPKPPTFLCLLESRSPYPYHCFSIELDALALCACVKERKFQMKEDLVVSLKTFKVFLLTDWRLLRLNT